MPSSGSSVHVDGKELSQWRQSLGWTQEFAAAQSGYTDRLIRKLESGGPVQRRTLVTIVKCYQQASGHTHHHTLATLTHPIAEDDLGELARRWLKNVYDKKRLNHIDEWTHADVVIHAEGIEQRGRDALRTRLTSIHNAFDPMQLSIEMLYVNGDAVIVYWRIRKQDFCEFRSVDQVGQWATIAGNSLFLFRDRRISLIREHWDAHEVL